MKKGILGLIIFLGIVGVCAPFVNGLVMEKVVIQTKNDLNAMYADMGSGVSIEIDRYDRGFSSSEIEWRIQLGKLATMYGMDEIFLVDRAEHGYTGVVSTTSLEKNPWFIEVLNSALNGANPVSITTAYTLTGTIESIINIDAFSFELDDETVAFRAGKFVTEGEKGLTHLISKGTWEGLSVSDTVLIDGISLTSDLEKVSTYIWDGEIAYAMKNFSIREQEANFACTDVKGTYILDYDKNNGHLSTGGELSIGSLTAEDEAVQDIFLKLGVNNIDALGYEEFMKIYTQTVYSVMGDINTNNEDPEKMAAMEEQMATSGLQMMAAYEKFLKEGLEFKISDLRADLSAGRVTGNMELLLLKDVTFAQLMPIAMQPSLAFEIFSLQSDFSFPATLAGDNATLIAPLLPGMQTGFFVEDGDYLVHKARTDNGKLFLNGNEVVFN